MVQYNWLRISGFLDFVHHLVFRMHDSVSETRSVSILRWKERVIRAKLGLLEDQWLIKWAELFLINPAEWVVPYFFTQGQAKSLENVNLCLKYQMKYKVQKSSNVKYNRPLSEYVRMSNTVIITVILEIQHIDPITAHILYQ
jgi:hypothetical protein